MFQFYIVQLRHDNVDVVYSYESVSILYSSIKTTLAILSLSWAWKFQFYIVQLRLYPVDLNGLHEFVSILYSSIKTA